MAPARRRNTMVLLVQAAITVAYIAVVGRAWSVSRRRTRAHGALYALPTADQAPDSAVGWPPEGSDFDGYVEDGLAAVDAYLSDSSAT
jgi:hypothetical protein